MLASLKIQNVALIPSVEIEFGERLNVLSGETGAGKSIILGSINFILGDKLNKNMIRTGASFARVDAVFHVEQSVGERITEVSGTEPEDGVVIVSRILKLDGKTDNRINGSVVTGAVLRSVADLLVHIHGQHETETLLKPKNHIGILDSFGAKELNQPKAAYEAEYREWKALERELEGLGGDEEERQRQIDIYQFQIREIEQAQLREGEDEELAEKKTRMQNFERIGFALTQTSGFLIMDGGVLSNFRQALAALSGVSDFDERLGKLYEVMEGVGHSLAEIEGDVTDYADSMEFDDEEFARVDSRLDEIKALRRKYGNTIAEILGFCDDAKTKMQRLVGAEAESLRIKKAIEEKQTRLGELGGVLSKKRREVAQNFEQKIVEELQPLGMNSARFAVETKQTKFRPDGVDEIEFHFSANVGEPLKPLSSVISGGELSRVMLVLKALSGGAVGTLVFDEIDTGIGGTIGHRIAEKLGHIASRSQVIAVTHLVQIASVANKHFLIEKFERDGRTETTVVSLCDVGRQKELSRMRGDV